MAGWAGAFGASGCKCPGKCLSMEWHFTRWYAPSTTIVGDWEKPSGESRITHLQCHLGFR